MQSLNYHHLHYFWVVAREGGLVAAARALHVSHPTISAQIHALEGELGERLFVKVGRKLVLSEMGRVVYRYAEEIFSLGREMLDTVEGRASGQPLRLAVGIADVVPKVVVRRMLQPALTLEQPVRILCHEGPYERLLADLALHTLDLVIADAPVPPGSNVRAFNHLLGETGVTVFAAPRLLQRHRGTFPRALDGAPFLLPLENVPLRRSLVQWFERHGLGPRVVAEFADSALLAQFGAEGLGFFPGPSVMESEITRQYGVHVAGHAPEIKERFYAISIERRLKNPAVVAICEAARQELFSDS